MVFLHFCNINSPMMAYLNSMIQGYQNVFESNGDSLNSVMLSSRDGGSRNSMTIKPNPKQRPFCLCLRSLKNKIHRSQMVSFWKEFLHKELNKEKERENTKLLHSRENHPGMGYHWALLAWDFNGSTERRGLSLSAQVSFQVWTSSQFTAHFHIVSR